MTRVLIVMAAAVTWRLFRLLHQCRRALWDVADRRDRVSAEWLDEYDRRHAWPRYNGPSWKPPEKS